jgi:hypothetical protein
MSGNSAGQILQYDVVCYCSVTLIAAKTSLLVYMLQRIQRVSALDAGHFHAIDIPKPVGEFNINSKI